MKNKNLGFYIFIFLLITTPLFALTGREIMGKNDALPKADTSIQESVLVIIHGKGPDARKTRKEFSGYMKRYGNETRMRMTFTKPTRLEFMAWDKKGEDKLQWIKTSGKKVRKIASSDKGKPWLNSHFYNDDIGEIDIDDYKYKLLGEADVDGLNCFKIESQKVRKEKGKRVPDTRVYVKTVVYVSKKDFLLRKVDFYEKRGFAKTLTFSHFEKIKGITTPLKTVMTRIDGKGKSLLYMKKKSIKYNVPVSDQKFNIEAK